MRGIVFALVFGLLFFGCTASPAGQCGSERSYVCGSDGNTYTNACYAGQAGVQVAYEGQCTAQQPAAEQCVDSDTGKNVLEAGTIAKGGVSYNDSCASTTAVFEYYCLENEVQSERVVCPEGTECSFGECLAPECQDADGQSVDIFGTAVKGAERRSDECADADTVREYYCEGNRIVDTLIACPAGQECSSGVCAAIQCSDSDGGSSIYERGTVRESGGVYSDYCSGTSSVKEYYCSGNTMVQITVNCGDEYYCSDGRCLEYTCSDTDSGRDEDEFGTVTKGRNGGEDSCYDSETVKEYYCDGNDVKYERRSCGSSETCFGGECVRIECTDTDEGSKRNIFGTVTVGGSSYSDYCLDLYSLREYFCSGSSMDYDDILCTGYGALCWNNVCSPATCEDSDGGMDEYTYGTVRLSTSNGYSDSESDSCSGSTSVREWYCSDLKMSPRTIGCGSGEECVSGRCVEATCTDSDGGKNWITPGTTSKGADSETDWCDPMDSHDLYEYYCSGNEIQYEIHYCPDECRTNAGGIGYCNPL